MASIIRIIKYDEESAISGASPSGEVAVNLPVDVAIERPLIRIVIDGLDHIASRLWFLQNE